ncbi:hypothetical protein [Actinoplanes derwentensis]|uniref:Uncharacterized protein n=1 Tax=Actinoplanes derwentensis TaxID=113562 RepID=A0A1H1TGL9_9ACTN|nr:hypothetical protein [Actinoplanes derwentensis]GID85026.1 hypothetical protein Ade03nite_39500 [Actinoplanes derwentensis]SDS59403.1 hypothetical protein SAMN04489716_1135 [Actinoplanes derwentensis]
MFDPALVVTWTTVALTQGPPGGPVPVAPLLTALATRIQQQLGTDALRELQADPDDPSVRAHLQARIERAAFYDPAFTQDLTRLQQDIDEQKLLDRFTLPAGGPLRHALPAGAIAAGSTVHARPWAPNHDGVASHIARNPWYSRALIIVGTLASVVSLANLVILMLRAPSAPPPYLPGAAQTLVVLCTGLVLLAAGVATSHPTRRR